MELESKEEENSASPFNDLYQMIKKSLDVKTPRRSSISQRQTPTSRFCSPKPVPVQKNHESLDFLTKDKATPKKDEIKAFPVAGEIDIMSDGTPESGKVLKSSQVPSNDISMSQVQNAKAEAPSVQKRIIMTPPRFTSSKVEQVTSQTSTSTVRRNEEATPAKPAGTASITQSHAEALPRHSGSAKTGNTVYI